MVEFIGGGCSGLEDAQEGCSFGDTQHTALPRLGCPAWTPPPRHPHSLQRAAEQQEQRLALAEDGQAAAGREAAELRATLRGLERDRLDARRELQELRRQVKGGDGRTTGGSPRMQFKSQPPFVASPGQVKALDSENSKKSKEVEELRARVAREEQHEEERHREAFGLRRKVVESEAGVEATRKEVGLLELSLSPLLSTPHPLVAPQ